MLVSALTGRPYLAIRRKQIGKSAFSKKAQVPIYCTVSQAGRLDAYIDDTTVGHLSEQCSKKKKKK